MKVCSPLIFRDGDISGPAYYENIVYWQSPAREP